MTTIGPQKRKNSVNFLIAGFLGVFVFAALVGVPLYTDIVNLKHEIRNGEKRIAEAEVENAEAENQLYEMLDAKRLERAAHDLGLVFDKKPTYLEIAPKDLARAL